jgi:hypothetical protein
LTLSSGDCGADCRQIDAMAGEHLSDAVALTGQPKQKVL